MQIMASLAADHEKPQHTREPQGPQAVTKTAQEASANELINASGHKQELERNFSLLNLCGVAITTGNTWTAIGGSVVSVSLHVLVRSETVVG